MPGPLPGHSNCSGARGGRNRLAAQQRDIGPLDTVRLGRARQSVGAWQKRSCGRQIKPLHRYCGINVYVPGRQSSAGGDAGSRADRTGGNLGTRSTPTQPTCSPYALTMRSIQYAQLHRAYPQDPILRRSLDPQQLTPVAASLATYHSPPADWH